MSDAARPPVVGRSVPDAARPPVAGRSVAVLARLLFARLVFPARGAEDFLGAPSSPLTLHGSGWIGARGASGSGSTGFGGVIPARPRRTPAGNSGKAFLELPGLELPGRFTPGVEG
ncbi:hypothetical protein AB0P21_04870 [Kribbella sp. NPDC056861]|uniref:hypothetical protein n=1 Tax=Kribbella sp. NPDC056861 TaxID=3154857 RepID=UPI00342A4291